MSEPSTRQRIFVKIAIAHLMGLWAAGVAGSIGTTVGLDLTGSIGLSASAIISLPWIAALGAFVWFHANWIDRHRIIFAVAGPITVCASWAALNGGSMLETVTISCVVSSIFFLLLPFLAALVPADFRRTLKWYFFDIPHPETE